MAGGGGDVTNTQRTELDPRMNNMLYGTETRQLREGVQPVYDMGGYIDTPLGREWSNSVASNRMLNPDSDYETTKTPGLVDYFQQQFQAGQNGANYAGMTDMQRNALNAQADYLNSPAALAGYNAQNAVGNYLVNGLVGNGNEVRSLSSLSGVGSTGGAGTASSYTPAPAAGLSGGSGTNKYSSMMPTAAGVQQVTSDQGYGDALSQILSGTPNNPYLQQMSQDNADLATQNFQRNVLPSIQSGAALAGGYGGSRQGIAEGVAMSDLNDQILRANNQLFGNAYEQAAQRQAAMTGQLSGQSLQASLANASNQLASQQQANDWELGNRNIAAQEAQAAASASNALNSYNLGMARLGFDQQQATIANALTGAGLLQSGSQVPLSNLQGIYNVGTTFQGEQQNQINAPLQNLQTYSSNLLPWSGLGATQVNTQPGGGGNAVGGAMGGALAGAQIGSAVPVIGTGYGALAGAALGLLGGMRR